MLPSRAKGSGQDPLSRRRSTSGIDPQKDSEALFRDIQPFALSCFNQSTLKRETAGPEVLYLYLFSLNLQLTFFPENMLHSLLYELNSPSSVTFCLKQATQLFTTCTEAGVTCSDSPKTHDCTSGFSHVQTPNCRDGTSRTTPAREFSPTPPPPRAPLGSAAQHPSVVCSKGSARDAVIWLLGASPHVASPTLHPEHQFRCWSTRMVPKPELGCPPLPAHPSHLALKGFSHPPDGQHPLCCDRWELLPQDKLFSPGLVPAWVHRLRKGLH